MRKIMIAIIGFIILCCLFYLGKGCYQVLSISSTIPPVKEYTYMGSVNQWRDSLRMYAQKNPEVKVVLTDTVVYEEVGYAYYADVELNYHSNKILYNIKFEDNKNTATSIQLVGAFNTTENTGGYGLKAEGMDVLVKILDNKLLNPLSKQHKMKIIPLNN